MDGNNKEIITNDTLKMDGNNKEIITDDTLEISYDHFATEDANTSPTGYRGAVYTVLKSEVSFQPCFPIIGVKPYPPKSAFAKPESPLRQCISWIVRTASSYL